MEVKEVVREIVQNAAGAAASGRRQDATAGRKPFTAQ